MALESNGHSFVRHIHVVPQGVSTNLGVLVELVTCPGDSVVATYTCVFSGISGRG